MPYLYQTSPCARTRCTWMLCCQAFGSVVSLSLNLAQGNALSMGINRQVNPAILEIFGCLLKITLNQLGFTVEISNPYWPKMPKLAYTFFSKSSKISGIGPFWTCDPSFDQKCLKLSNAHSYVAIRGPVHVLFAKNRTPPLITCFGSTIFIFQVMILGHDLR